MRAALVVVTRVLVALLSAAVLAGSGYGWATLKRVRESVNTTNVLSVLSDVPNAPPMLDGATDILLVGSDSRTDAQGNALPAGVLRQLRTEASEGVNTDTIIVLRVPHHGGKAMAISIPRDTYVPIPDIGDDKINGAYGLTKYATIRRLENEGVTDQADLEKQGDQAGRRALVQVVQDLTGVRVDHYAEINLYGFYLLTEVIGGVEVCLNSGTSDPSSGANFGAGRQRVTGSDALAFVRQRNLPGGDLGRIRRQQVFLSAAVTELLSAGTFTDQDKLSGLLDAATKSIVVDEGLDLVTLAQEAKGIAGGSVEFATIPVVDVNARNERGQSIVQVDVPAVKAFVGQLLGPTLVPSTPPSPPQRMAGGKVVGLDGAHRAAQPEVPCID